MPRISPSVSVRSHASGRPSWLAETESTSPSRRKIWRSRSPKASRPSARRLGPSADNASLVEMAVIFGLYLLVITVGLTVYIAIGFAGS
jgi:hypothetical protein